jgi:hypothetical protein
MKTGNFLVELKRRDVYKVAAAYAVVSWLLVQAASILLPTFDAPAWVMKAFLILLALGFTLSVIVSWIFEMTPEGIKRTDDLSPDEVPDIVRQLEAQARQQFVRGYLFALSQAGSGDRAAIDYLRDYGNHENIGIRVDPLRSDPRFETLADKTLAITRPVRSMLKLSKQLRRTLAQAAPPFPAVEEILSAPITRSHTSGKAPQTIH